MLGLKCPLLALNMDCSLNQEAPLQLRSLAPSQVDTLRSTTSLMSMYINRCNSAWADAQTWAAPSVVPHHEELDWKKGDQHSKYHANVIKKLSTGKVSFICWQAGKIGIHF
jgi:hypothetical protein